MYTESQRRPLNQHNSSNCNQEGYLNVYLQVTGTSHFKCEGSPHFSLAFSYSPYALGMSYHCLASLSDHTRSHLIISLGPSPHSFAPYGFNKSCFAAPIQHTPWQQKQPWVFSLCKQRQPLLPVTLGVPWQQRRS